MRKLTGVLAGLLVPAFIVAGVIATPAIAQDKGMVGKAEKGKVSVKVLAQNDKVVAQEVRFKPGDQNTSIATTSYRVVRALKGGTIMRTYADGKTEKKEWKTGEVGISAPSGAYTAKNVGKSEIVLYVVVLK